MREINHPLTGIHNIVRESTTSRKRHDITQRLTSHILETVHGWLTAHTTVYNKERGHTLLAREYDESTLGGRGRGVMTSSLQEQRGAREETETAQTEDSVGGRTM